MNIETIISSIVNLPDKFNRVANISIYSLLKETGYFEMHNQVNEIGIIKYLVNHTECINQWLCWSEDKRSSSGWYFKESEEGKYLVGYFPTKENFKPIEYSDLTEACAAYIKHEIEDIRTS
jgi:hypothetical protein